MLYREIIAVCSQIHTKHINTLCCQNVELLNIKLAVHTYSYINIRVLHGQSRIPIFFKLVFPNFTYRLAHTYVKTCEV